MKQRLLIVVAGIVSLYLMWMWVKPNQAEATMTTCPDGGAWQKDETANNGFDETCSGGKKVTQICIKGGTVIEYYTTNGNDGCWARSGIGTSEGDAWKIGSGSSCKDISHASYKCESVSPTPTPTRTPTHTPHPTHTPRPTATPSPTCKPSVTPTTPPEVCEIQSWSCNECQKISDDVCYNDQEKYCASEYGCEWVGDAGWSCEDTCEPEVTPTQGPEATPTPGESENPKKSDMEVNQPSCTSNNFTAKMTLKDESDKAMKDITVRFQYKDQVFHVVTNDEGSATANFTYTEKGDVKAEASGFDTQSRGVEAATNCGAVLGISSYAATGSPLDILGLYAAGLTMITGGITVYAQSKKTK